MSNHKSLFAKQFFYFQLHSTMKVTASKDFGNPKKPLLPLVPEPVTVTKKEDLAQVDLLSNESEKADGAEVLPFCL